MRRIEDRARFDSGASQVIAKFVAIDGIADKDGIHPVRVDDIADGLPDSHAGLLRELVGGASCQEMDNGTVQLRAALANPDLLVLP